MQSVDLVGDIHAQSDEFESLLLKMGYKPFERGYRHPERTLIMIGDLIDGSGSVAGQRRVVEIAQSMVRHSDAVVIMGNHEFNAICYATKMPDGSYARPHTDNNLKQHQLFLDAFPFGSEDYLQAIEFFKSMPLWLDTLEYRVVHACWNDAAMKRMRSFLDDHNRIESDSVYVRFGFTEQPLYDDLELVLKGPEIRLPQGVSFQDRYGHTRHNTRVKWWYSGEDKSQKLVIEKALQRQHDLTGLYESAEPFCYQEDIPVFFGHYWLTPESFEKEKANYPAVCLDYSVARKGGVLTAIRFAESLEQSQWFHVKRVT